MTVLFWILAGLLAVAGIGVLVRPLVRSTPSDRLERRAATLAAHRARLAEIEGGEAGAEPADPELAREAREDVARSLLRDLDGDAQDDPQPVEARRMRPRRRAAILLGVSLPALAAAIYAWIGEPTAVHLPGGQSTPRTAAALGAEVGRLLQKAETIARANGNRLDGEPARLVEQALVLAPEHRKALWFSAIAALHEERAEDARRRLVRLGSLGPMDEEEREMYDRLMAEAAARLSGS